MIQFSQSACCRHHRGWRIARYCDISRYQPDGLQAWQLARPQVIRIFLEFLYMPDSLSRNAASHFRHVSVVFLPRLHACRCTRHQVPAAQGRPRRSRRGAE